MADTDHVDENEVLRRMLSTPHEPHKPLRTGPPKKRGTKANKGR